jgi:Cu2+-exporting ATPase
VQKRAGDPGPQAAHVTAVVEVCGVQWATEKARVDAVLGRRPGVLGVEANPVSQTATVTYDPALTSVAELTDWVRDCGYHCRGLSVPEHVCDPLAEPRAARTPLSPRLRPVSSSPHSGSCSARRSPR